jgi:Zn-dependent metalloprotease
MSKRKIIIIITAIIAMAVVFITANFLFGKTKQNPKKEKIRIENQDFKPQKDIIKDTYEDYSIDDLISMNEYFESFEYKCSETGQLIYLNGKFTRLNANDINNIFTILNNIRTLFGIEDASNELKLLYKDEINNNSTYVFQQIYNGYEVYGCSLTLYVNNFGIPTELDSNLTKTSTLKSVPLAPLLSKDKIEDIVLEYFKQSNDLSSIKNIELKIYVNNNEANLVYEVDTIWGDIFVNASNGNILQKETV